MSQKCHKAAHVPFSYRRTPSNFPPCNAARRSSRASNNFQAGKAVAGAIRTTVSATSASLSNLRYQRRRAQFDWRGKKSGISGFAVFKDKPIAAEISSFQPLLVC
jgi:hypothetical protein